MGNSFAKNNVDSINWNKINTEDMSDTQDKYFRINQEATDLLSNLTIPTLSDSELDINELFEKKVENTNENKNESKQEGGSEEFSDTSPFISSEMYKYLLESGANKNVQQGGSYNENEEGCGKKIQSGGAKTKVVKKNKKNTSETSSTSISVSQNVRRISSNKQHSGKSNSIKTTDSSVSMDGGDSISYFSSSAHTDGLKSKINSTESVEQTTISVGNEKILSDSVNTSDINMISVEN